MARTHAAELSDAPRPDKSDTPNATSLVIALLLAFVVALVLAVSRISEHGHGRAGRRRRVEPVARKAAGELALAAGLVDDGDDARRGPSGVGRRGALLGGGARSQHQGHGASGQRACPVGP